MYLHKINNNINKIMTLSLTISIHGDNVCCKFIIVNNANQLI